MINESIYNLCEKIKLVFENKTQPDLKILDLGSDALKYNLWMMERTRKCEDKITLMIGGIY